MQDLNWKNIYLKGIKAARRFPLTVIFALLGTISYIAINHLNFNDKTYFKIILCCHLAIPLFTAIQLFLESYVSLLWHKITAYLLSFSFLIFFWFLIPNPDDNYTVNIFFPLLLSFHFLVAIGGFIFKSTNAQFWHFNVQIFIQFAIAVFYSLILTGGIEGAIYAIRILLDVQWYREIYFDLLVVIMGIFNTLFWLSTVPKIHDDAVEESISPLKILPLVKFILVPITLLYFFILYLYGIKIMSIGELPKGWIASLCIGFSIVGFLTYLLNFLLPDFDNTKWIHWFKKYYYFLLIPIIVLMHISVWRRFSDYGLTEQRYYLILFSIWISLVAMYYIASRKDDLRAIPLSLAIFCFISAVGPLNGVRLSIQHQAKLFSKLFKENFNNGKMNSSLSEEDKNKLIGKIEFLQQHKALDAITNNFPFYANLSEINKSGMETIDTLIHFIDKDTKNLNEYIGGNYIQFKNTWTIEFLKKPVKKLQYQNLVYKTQEEINEDSVFIKNNFIIFKNSRDTIDVVSLIEKNDKIWNEKNSIEANLCYDVKINSDSAMICIHQMTIFAKENNTNQIQQIEFFLFH